MLAPGKAIHTKTVKIHLSKKSKSNVAEELFIGRVPFIREETAEACDWLHCHVTEERDIIDDSSGGAETERVPKVS